MKFNFKNMIKSIREIVGKRSTNSDLLNLAFTDLILKKDLRYGEKLLEFNNNRTSAFLNDREPFYRNIVELVDDIDGDLMPLLKAGSKTTFMVLFNKLNVERIMNNLRALMESDITFNDEIKNKILNDSMSNEEIYAYYLYACLLVEYEKDINGLRKLTTDGIGKTIRRVANSSLIGEIIRNIVILEKKQIKPVEHKKTWSLDDKLKKNKINTALSMKIKRTFIHFDVVMDAITDLKNEYLLIDQVLYSFYEDIYCDILDRVLGDNFKENDILNKSNQIFKNVNEEVLTRLVKSNKLGSIKIEELEIYLYAITVTVFYNCKFLLKVDEEI